MAVSLGTASLKRPAPRRIVALGDSTTAARAGVTVYADRLQARFDGAGLPVTVVNAGVRGDHSEGARARFSTEVLAHKPDCVIIQLGINDAAVDVWADPPATQSRVAREKFVANLDFFCRALRAEEAVVILCTPNPLAWTPALIELYGKPPYAPDDADGFNVLLKTYADAVRHLAARRRLPLIDIDAAMRARRSSSVPPWGDLLLDGMHPNDDGHALVADLLWPALRRCAVPDSYFSAQTIGL